MVGFEINTRQAIRTMLKRTFYSLAATALVVIATGCHIIGPKARLGTLPSATAGSRFLEPGGLGWHSYLISPFERNGIVYTCNGGHIDLAHVRWNADYTKYTAKRTLRTLVKKRKGFWFNVVMEPSKHQITFEYPQNWDNLSELEKETIANDISIHVGPYIAYNATVWHEILTWFNVHFVGIEPEFHSSFSWEDMYSNLLGTTLGVEAIQDKEHGYNKAMTLAINRKLEELGAQPKKTAIDASKKMKGIWFSGGTPITGNLFVKTLKKNVDIGIDDGYVTPVIVPGICNDANPVSLPVHNLDVLKKYGFKMKYEIFPNVWEEDEILQIVHSQVDGKAIEPDKHYPAIMEFIKKQAVEKYGYDID